MILFVLMKSFSIQFHVPSLTIFTGDDSCVLNDDGRQILREEKTIQKHYV